MDFKNIILFLVVVINLILGLFIFLKSIKRDEYVWVYFLLVLWASSWAFGIAMFRLSVEPFWMWFWNVEFIIAASLIASSLVHFSLVFHKKGLSLFQKFLIYSPNLVIVYAALTPGVLIKDIVVQSWGNESILGWGYIYFGLYFIIYVFLVFYSLWKNFSRNIGIAKAQIIYMSLGFFISLLFGATFNLFFILLGNYKFIWLGPYASCIMILFAGYAIIKYRFLNIKLTITNTTKKIIAFLLASSVGVLIHFLIKFNYQNENALLVTSFFAFYLALIAFEKFFNTHYFYKIFGITSVEYFQRVIEELKNNIVMHKTTAELEKSLKKNFCEKLKITNLKIILLDKQKQARKKYPQLIKHFQERPEILVTKELESLYSQNKIKIPYLAELKSLGEVCLPLFRHYNKELVGLFILGEKAFRDAYSVEEIQAIQSLDKYLSLALMSILLNLDLQAEVVRLKEIVDSTVSVTQHELRTPTSVIQLALQIIEENNIAPEIKQEMIKSARQASQKLSKIVQSVISVQALQKGIKLNITNVNIYDFILNLKKKFDFLLMKKKIRLGLDLKIPKNTFIQADRERLWKVFSILISNAEKFTPAEGKVILQASKTKKELIIKVIDNGEGVPKDKQEFIFERFCTNHHNKGIALGLYICQKIIELHEGKIWYENTKGGGATFCVSLKFS